MPELNEICTEQDEIELLRREQGRLSSETASLRGKYSALLAHKQKLDAENKNLRTKVTDLETLVIDRESELEETTHRLQRMMRQHVRSEKQFAEEKSVLVQKVKTLEESERGYRTELAQWKSRASELEKQVSHLEFKSSRSSSSSTIAELSDAIIPPALPPRPTEQDQTALVIAQLQNTIDELLQQNTTMSSDLEYYQSLFGSINNANTNVNNGIQREGSIPELSCPDNASLAAELNEATTSLPRKDSVETLMNEKPLSKQEKEHEKKLSSIPYEELEQENNHLRHYISSLLEKVMGDQNLQHVLATQYEQVKAKPVLETETNKDGSWLKIWSK